MTGRRRRALPLLVAVLAIATAAFGLGFMFLPGPIWSLYGVQLDVDGAFVARMFGTANVGAGLLLFWACSTLAKSADAGGLLAALSLWSIARGAITSSALAAGMTNGAGWVFVAYDLALLIIYGLIAVGARPPGVPATAVASSDA